MATPTQPMAAEIAALREVFDGLNRNDVEACLRHFEAQIERADPPGLPGADTWHGIAAVREHIVVNRGKWAEGSCEPQRFTVGSGRIVVSVQVHVRLQHETGWRDGRVSDAFAFRDGKIIAWRTFLDERAAFAWAGITNPAG